MRIERGTVVLVALDPTLGHEQRGLRPCVIVSNPDVNEDQRFPLICVVPITGTKGEGALYPPLAPGNSGLRKPSTALVDQIRSVDKRRIHRLFGKITSEELDAIDEGLILFLGLFPTTQYIKIPTNEGKTCVFAAMPAQRFQNQIRFDIASGHQRVLAESAPDFAAQLTGGRRVGNLHGFAGQVGFFRQSWGPGWAWWVMPPISRIRLPPTASPMRFGTPSSWPGP